MTAWLVAAIIIMLAAALQSVTGFGFALISVPLLLFVYDAHTAVTINMIVSFTSLLILTIRVRKQVLRPVVANLFLGSLAGIPWGAYVFLHFDVSALKVIISIVTLLTSALMMLKISLRKAAGRWLEILVGTLSGFLTSSISMPGPPVILFLNHQRLPKDHFRATTSAYFTLVYPASFLLLFLMNGIEVTAVKTSVYLMPFAIIGQNLGFFLFPRISQDHFQKGVPVLVMATAAYALVSSLF